MWLALPGQVLRLSLLRSQARGVAGHRVRCLLPVADMRVHAVVAAFRSKRKACEGDDGRHWWPQGVPRRPGMRSQGRAARQKQGTRCFSEAERPERGDGRVVRDVACAAQGWPRSDGWCCLFLVVLLLFLLPFSLREKVPRRGG